MEAKLQKMLLRLLGTLSILLVSFDSVGATANAACGQGMVPTYADINAVQYERSNCFGTCRSYRVSSRRDAAIT